MAAERWGVASCPAGSGKAGTVLINVAVPDLDAVTGEIAERGKFSLPIETVEGVGRKARYLDLESNCVTFFEVPGG